MILALNRKVWKNIYLSVFKVALLLDVFWKLDAGEGSLEHPTSNHSFE